MKQGTFGAGTDRDWNEVAKEARTRAKTVHAGRVFGICTEKNSELPKSQRSWKGRGVFQGNDVRDQNAEIAVCDSLSSTRATMEGSRAVDAYGLVEGNINESADAEQTYIQTNLEGDETRVMLPEKYWDVYFPNWRRM